MSMSILDASLLDCTPALEQMSLRHRMQFKIRAHTVNSALEVTLCCTIAILTTDHGLAGSRMQPSTSEQPASQVRI